MAFSSINRYRPPVLRHELSFISSQFSTTMVTMALPQDPKASLLAQAPWLFLS
jgi:hypothetical protein